MGSYYRKKYAKKNQKNKREDFIINIFAIIAIAVLAFSIFYTNTNDVKNVKIGIADLQSFKIPYKTYAELERLSKKNNLDFARLLTIFALENEFFPNHAAVTPTDDILKEFIENYKYIQKQYPEHKIEDYDAIIRNIHDELIYFPIPQGYEDYSFNDSYGAQRTYGGERIHQGTDIMDKNNIRGKIPIVSMTDGIIQNIGWNEKGGFRIGVLSDSGTYYYYAHFDSFEHSLVKGAKVLAGDLLGYMGDSGYSKVEGTKGIFPVHLHLGISPKTSLSKDEFWINPYVFLRSIEDMKVKSVD